MTHLPHICPAYFAKYFNRVCCFKASTCLSDRYLPLLPHPSFTPAVFSLNLFEQVSALPTPLPLSWLGPHGDPAFGCRALGARLFPRNPSSTLPYLSLDYDTHLSPTSSPDQVPIDCQIAKTYYNSLYLQTLLPWGVIAFFFALLSAALFWKESRDVGLREAARRRAAQQALAAGLAEAALTDHAKLLRAQAERARVDRALAAKTHRRRTYLNFGVKAASKPVTPRSLRSFT